MRAVFLFLFVLAAACTSAELPAPVLYVKHGPAAERPIRRIVALPATCAAVAIDYTDADPERKGNGTYARCPTEGLAAIDQAIRGTLDFQGYQVIDSEQVNRETGLRQEIQSRNRLRTTSTTTDVSRSLFADATPNEQREILRALGADGVIETRVYLGATIGVSRRRPLTVQIRLRTAEDELMVWVRRCELEAFALNEKAEIEKGARCAIERER
jgi:hypothetical protein